MRFPFALAVVLAIASLGCPPADKKPSPAEASSGSCRKIGQSCEFSPGKLGTCVQKDDCGEPAGCFVCQSQH